MTDPTDAFASGCEIAAAVRSGAAKAEDVVAACLERIRQVDTELNAFTVVFEEEALERARTLSTEQLAGPLAGVPVAVKDHVWMAGAPATNGSRALADFVPDVDSVGVARLRAAGAVLVGKTNNPEFCYRGHTTSPLYGATRNPFDLSRSPSGSSGGSAVAVSAGMTPLAVGTDGGGSIRGPAAFCAVVGHKPSLGLVPTRPGFLSWPTLSVHGPIGRNVRDVALMLSVMAGQHPSDPATFPVDTAALASAPERYENLRGFKVAVSDDMGFAVVDPRVRQMFWKAVQSLESLGCELVDARVPSTNPIELWTRIADAESFASEGQLVDGAHDLSAFSVQVLRHGATLTAGEYLEAQEERRILAAAWGELFNEIDLLVYPAESILPPVLEPIEDTSGEQEWGMSAIANLTCQPATALPCGLTSSGLPVGIELLGRRYHDADVLAAAYVVEQALGRGVPPPLGPATAP